MSAITPNKHGLVPVKFLFSEAGAGIMSGEIRGVSPDQAEKLIAAKKVELVAVPKEKTAPAATA